jgi:tetratricopeptide (TPR) repeat protein
MIETMLQAERLLTMGMLDQAESLYRRAADADPRNAMAVVGLARVASERGDDEAAHGHACRALEIDPENALALRLEARLAEMLAARGEAVERPAWLVAERGSGADRPGPSPEPGPPPVAPPTGDLGEAAQRAAFTRNPSMADHQRRMDEQRQQPEAEAETTAASQPAPRRGFLQRLLGR